MAESKIEWTDTVWNPVRGCVKVSRLQELLRRGFRGAIPRRCRASLRARL